MTEHGTGRDAHDRGTFEAQGEAFLKENLAEKPEFDYTENRPPHSDGLARRTLTLALRDKPEGMRHAFRSKTVEVQILGDPGPRRVTARYEAFQMAPGIFFVSYRLAKTESVAMVLDLVNGAATLVQGEMRAEGIVSRVESARIEGVGGPGGGVEFYHPPFNLGGTRLVNVYAHNVVYEHVYLTGVYETWLGVRGPEVGQADTEEYRAFKIADGVYLVYWNEKVLVTQMVFVFNFFVGNCVGQLFARMDREIVHNTVGANTSLVHTKLPELSEVVRLDVYSGD
ncbi:MAG: MoaF N-terminal domain-containing protein [Thermoleophilia bacterium]|nr:MoaF N-terminal domain-containing protein [Thermoleophilia bacterium]